jgi:hypothetical protein
MGSSALLRTAGAAPPPSPFFGVSGSDDSVLSPAHGAVTAPAADGSGAQQWRSPPAVAHQISPLSAEAAQALGLHHTRPGPTLSVVSEATNSSCTGSMTE